MSLSQTNRRWIALFAILAFLWMCEVSQVPLGAAKVASPGTTEVAKESDTPGAVEKSGGTPVVKKRSPILWIVLGAVLVAGAAFVYFYVLQKFTLTVTKTAGVEGLPEAGSTEHKRTDKVSYSYTLMAGYKNLAVTLDGAPVAASGSVKMSGNHTLAASAVEEYTLTVSIDDGVAGTPATGIYTYAAGTSVSYSYSLKAGFTNLAVKLDGAAVAASGSFTMTGNRSLTAETTGQRKLTVIKGSGVSGTPSSGTYSYLQGATALYNYSVMTGYKGFVVMLDGVPVVPIGLITMNADHTLQSGATNALELYWPFTGTAQDSSGKGRHGTVYNATLTSDRFGSASRAYYFNGTNAYISGPDFIAQDGNKITASLWVRIPAATASLKWFLTGNDFMIGQSGTTISFSISTPATNSASCSIPLNAWTHIAGTYDGANIRIYRNGVLMSTVPKTGNIADFNRNFLIGQFSAAYWQGYVDEVRVYSYCMTQADIAYLAGL